MKHVLYCFLTRCILGSIRGSKLLTKILVLLLFTVKLSSDIYNNTDSPLIMGRSCQLKRTVLANGLHEVF